MKAKDLYNALLVGGSGGGVTPTGTINITENGTYDVADKATANVSVASANTILNEMIDNNDDTIETSYTIPPTITSIRQHGLRNLRAERVSGSAVTSLQDSAFSNNSIIKSLSLPVATTFGDYAIERCGNLEEVNFPLLYQIGQKNFQYARKLPSLSLPELVTMGNECIYAMNILTTLNVPKLTTAGKNFVYDCRKINTINAPLLQTAGDNFLSYSGYEGSQTLTDVVFPSLTTLGKSAFNKLDNEQMIIDCPVLASIGSGAFGNGKFMALVLRKTDDACVLSGAIGGSSTFARNIGYVYVPRALLSTYQAATNWIDISTRFRAIEDYTVDGTVTGAMDRSLMTA